MINFMKDLSPLEKTFVKRASLATLFLITSAGGVHSGLDYDEIAKGLANDAKGLANDVKKMVDFERFDLESMVSNPIEIKPTKTVAAQGYEL